jgi:hypothetical protein
LYRCYDNRLQKTARKLDYYEEREGADTVLSIKDDDDSTNFGDGFPREKSDKLGWWWSFKGQIKIISTQFLEGGLHYAKRPGDFIPIVEELAKMHKANYVHGDIRAFNMLFNCKTLKGEKENNATDGTDRDDNLICGSQLDHATTSDSGVNFVTSKKPEKSSEAT